jgi:hypothetical protein
VFETTQYASIYFGKNMVVLQKKTKKILEGSFEVANPRQPAPIMLF